MKYFIITLSVFAASCTGAKQDNSIVLGKIDSIHSGIIGENRKIWIYLPDGAKEETGRKKRYPVVYLLDGDAHFQSVVGMIQQLSSVNGNTVLPEMIVIGIPNTNRMRDLTPTHVVVDPPYIDSSAGKSSGGGEKFISFIEKELIPHIDSLYPTLPYRVFVGHSLGGLTVMNTLIHHPSLFNAYLSIDPSMWWDNEKLLDEIKATADSKSFAGKSLFVGIANTMTSGMDTAKVQNDTTPLTRHIRAILELNKYFAQNTPHQLRYRGRYYNDDDHGSVPLISEYDAMHFFFDFYPLKLAAEEQFNVTMPVVHKIEDHYKAISKQFGYAMPVPEDLASYFGYRALEAGSKEEAEYLFRLNLSNYPESSGVHVAMGDFFGSEGNKEEAIDQYKKALAIQDSPETRKKLEDVKR